MRNCLRFVLMLVFVVSQAYATLAIHIVKADPDSISYVPSKAEKVQSDELQGSAEKALNAQAKQIVKQTQVVKKKKQHGVPRASQLAEKSALEDLAKQAQNGAKKSQSDGSLSYSNINQDTLKSVAPQCVGKKGYALRDCLDKALNQLGETAPKPTKPTKKQPSHSDSSHKR